MKSAPFLTDEIRHGNINVVEEKFCCVLTVHTDLVEIATAFKACHRTFNNHQRHTSVPLRWIGFRGDNHKVRIDPVGDESFGAVENVAVAVATSSSSNSR